MLKLKTVPSVKPLAQERGWNYRTHHPAVTLYFQPSGTTLEAFTDFIDHGAEWISIRDANTFYGKPLHGARSFARLYGIDEYSIGESFSCEIPNAFLLGDDGIISTDLGEVLVESYVMHGAFGTRFALAKSNPDFRQIATLAGDYVSLRGFAANNYCHWLLDMLPRLTMLDALDLEEDTKYILPASLKPFHLESLRLLGFDDTQLVTVEGRCIQVERLIMCHAAPKVNRPLPAHLFAMTQRIKSAVLGEALPKPTRRLYVSRVNTTRIIVNEDELLPVLHEFGFEVIRCERLSFAEQVQLFAETSVVVGPHGAGLCNHIFCPPDTAVVELYHPHTWGDNVQRTTALYGHKHWHLYGAPVSDGGTFNMRVDPDKLRKLLALACPS